MGFKTKIKVKNKPIFSEHVIRFKLNRLLDPLWFIFNDEWDGDNRIHLGALVGIPNGQNDMKIYIQKLYEMAEISDERIESHIRNAWNRDAPYWNKLKDLGISYLKAKRDYIRDLTKAEVEEVIPLLENVY